MNAFSPRILRNARIDDTVAMRGDVKMDTEQIAEAFRRIPVDERARLVEELWDEIARELEERIRQHHERPTDVEPWETARDDILRGL